MSTTAFAPATRGERLTGWRAALMTTVDASLEPALSGAWLREVAD
jgi:hypothetical protein